MAVPSATAPSEYVEPVTARPPVEEQLPPPHRSASGKVTGATAAVVVVAMRTSAWTVRVEWRLADTDGERRRDRHDAAVGARPGGHRHRVGALAAQCRRALAGVGGVGPEVVDGGVDARLGGGQGLGSVAVARDLADLVHGEVREDDPEQDRHHHHRHGHGHGDAPLVPTCGPGRAQACADPRQPGHDASGAWAPTIAPSGRWTRPWSTSTVKRTSTRPSARRVNVGGPTRSVTSSTAVGGPARVTVPREHAARRRPADGDGRPGGVPADERQVRGGGARRRCGHAAGALDVVAQLAQGEAGGVERVGLARHPVRVAHHRREHRAQHADGEQEDGGRDHHLDERERALARGPHPIASAAHGTTVTRRRRSPVVSATSRAPSGRTTIPAGPDRTAASA